MAKYKKRVDMAKLRQKQLQYMSNLDQESKVENSGVGNKRRPNPVPIYVQAQNEEVYGNENTGARIVCGADREHSVISGKGGEGQPNCGAVRITAGPMGSQARSVDQDGNPLYANPHNEFDAATFYISQKCDVDEAFNLMGTSPRLKDRSAVALKADGVRLAARDGGINLFAGRGDRIGSQGQEIIGKGKINFVIDNDPDATQPIIRGDNLAEGLSKMAGQIQDLINIVSGFMQAQMAFNKIIAIHTHPIPPITVQAPPGFVVPMVQGSPPPSPPPPIGSTSAHITVPSPEVGTAAALCAMLQAPQKISSTLLGLNSVAHSINHFDNPASTTYIKSRHIRAG
jgi:hypothetical protein